jgi:hypothetical protein
MVCGNGREHHSAQHSGVGMVNTGRSGREGMVRRMDRGVPHSCCWPGWQAWVVGTGGEGRTTIRLLDGI